MTPGRLIVLAISEAKGSYPGLWTIVFIFILFWSARFDHGDRSIILKAIQLRLRQLSVFPNTQVILHQTDNMMPDRLIILAISETTSSAAFSSVANLNAAQKVS